MSSRPRPRSASLKALPPDSPTQPEVTNLSAGAAAAAHWSVTKEKPAAGRPRPLKSVSLKLAKGDGSPTSMRSNSAGGTGGTAWGSGELVIDARQQVRRDVGSGPPSRGSACEVPQAASVATRQRQGQPQSSRTRLVESHPTAARPPMPRPAAEASFQNEGRSSSYPSRPSSFDEEANSRPSSAAYQRAAAIYASLPKTPEGTRTLVRDADGFIFRPSMQAESVSTRPVVKKEPEEEPQQRPADGRSMGELERSIAKARERAERSRQELTGYMESLRSKIFHFEDGNPTNEELLVSLPPDFDDVVDINASLTASERSRPSSGGKGVHSSQLETIDAGFKLPSFLVKYFQEDLGQAELPIVKMQKQESELEKVARQVAKLDRLLSRQEAEGLARLKAVKEEIESTKESLRRESEKTEAEKLQLLKKLKEKGLLRSQPSGLSKAPPAESSSNDIPREKARSAACFTPSVGSEVDWSGWECSAEVESTFAPSKDAWCATPQPAHGDHLVTPEPAHGDQCEGESDTTTFTLTATTADLTKISQGLPPKQAKFDPVVEDTLHEEKGVVDDGAGEELVVPSPLPEELLADPYDLQAIHAIDDQLAKIIPESEWEAKSIRSVHNGSDVSAGHVSAGVKSKMSKQSAFSYLSSSSLPGEPVLREQLEERESRKALSAINDRLGRLQEERHSELKPEQLQQLLLEAAASQVAMDSSSKVLTLTAEAGDLEDSLKRMLQPLPVTPQTPETSGPALAQARKILARLSEVKEEWDSTSMEARCSFVELQDSVKALEATASRPSTAEQGEQVQSVDPDPLVAEISSWATKLQELSQEASLLAEQGMPTTARSPEVDTEGPAASMGAEEPLPPPLADLATYGPKVGPSHQTDLEDSLKLPMLGAPMEDLEASSLLSDEDSDGPVFLPVPDIEVTKALDPEILPEGPWSDEMLERLSRAMEEHFGPVAK
ncbi:unnamed protein product [Durusdinium trenchii]|uniref:Fibrous sheath-interacting protein 1 n=1 Tax=Durusdinium trenchii TaxID=1381693 RepID=A0ABP0J4I4_9DINO